MSLMTTALSMLQTAVPLTRHTTKHAMADRKPNLPLAVITLAGTQEEMGRQHGELLREAGGWQPAVEYYPRMVECMVVGKREHAIQAALPLALRPWIRLALDSLHRHRRAQARRRARHHGLVHLRGGLRALEQRQVQPGREQVTTPQPQCRVTRTGCHQEGP